MPYKDIKRQREYQRNWLSQRRAAYLEGKACVGCGAVDSLEIDHVDPDEKLSHRVWSWTTDRRAAELAKCQILCHACHSVKTQGAPQHGTAWMYKQHHCRCRSCTQANTAAVRRYRQKKKGAP